MNRQWNQNGLNRGAVSNGNSFRPNNSNVNNRSFNKSQYQNNYSRNNNNNIGGYQNGRNNFQYNSRREPFNTIISEDLIQEKQKSMVIDEKVDTLINTMSEKLDFAQARIEALSNRNDSLSQSAHSGNKSSSFPINFMMMLTLFLAL